MLREDQAIRDSPFLRKSIKNGKQKYLMILSKIYCIILHRNAIINKGILP